MRRSCGSGKAEGGPYKGNPRGQSGVTVLTKKLLLLRAKRTVRALREISKPQRANRHADEAQHLDAQSVEHAANLAIFPFIDDHFEPGVFFAGAKRADS